MGLSHRGEWRFLGSIRAAEYRNRGKEDGPGVLTGLQLVFLTALPMEQNEMQECGTGCAACMQVLVEATAVQVGESHQMTAVRALL